MKGTAGNVWSRFVAIAAPFFRSERRWRAYALLAVLAVLLLAVSGLNVVNSFVNRFFMTAVERRQPDRFVYFAVVYVAVFAASTVVSVFSTYVEARFGLMWRDWLTRRFIDKYLNNFAYYRVKTAEEVDNPDQRIAEDVRSFASTTLGFALMLVNSTITVVAFLGVLWTITPWLFIVAAGYAAFGSVSTFLLGRKLIGLDNLQLKKEADFRYQLVHLRENAESISLLGAEKDENVRLGRRLTTAIDNFKQIIFVNRRIGFFTAGYNYLIQLLPLLITAPMYIRGEIEFGEVTQSQMAFNTVVAAFSLVVVQFANISAYAAVVTRLGSLWEALDRAAKTPPPIKVVVDDSKVAYDHLTLRTPKEGRPLVKGLSLEVPAGRRLLIDGPNGAGKTALVRATLGIWEGGEGRVIRPARARVLFLPQRPYISPGPLRDQLVPAKGVDDDRLLEALRDVTFGPILERFGGLDADHDWPNVLSLGEQQLLAFARLLLTRPRYAFLDEATTALDPERARHVYDLLSRTDMTYISVAEHHSLLDYHDDLLELHEDGTWKLSPTAERVAEAAGAAARQPA